MRAIGASNYTAPRLALALDDERSASACRATSRCSRSTTWSSAPPTRPSSSRLCRRARPRRHQLLRAGERLSHRQVPQRGRPRQERARRRRASKYLNERGLRGPRRARRRRRRRRRDAGAGRARLADRAAEHHRADRERDHRRRSSTSWSARRALPPRHAVDRADRSRQPAAPRHERRARRQAAVDDAGAGLRRRDRHPVDGHPPRLRPLAAADHHRARLEPRDLRVRARGAEPRLGHRRAVRRRARRPLGRVSRPRRRQRCSTPPAWWRWAWRPRARAFSAAPAC